MTFTSSCLLKVTASELHDRFGGLSVSAVDAASPLRPVEPLSALVRLKLGI
jgi:hypothetical protein